MLNDNAKQWVAALRSGEYQQGQKYLNNNNRFCCLGVACDLAVKAGLEIEVTFSTEGVTSYDGENAYPPFAVLQHLGLTSFAGWINGTKDCLTIMNDTGATFAEIADLIESEPAGLFREAA